MPRFHGNLDEFADFQVVQWNPGDPLGDPASQIHRLSTEYDSKLPWSELLAKYLAQPGVEHMPGLVVGYWAQDILSNSDVQALMVRPLTAAAQKLGGMRALYINDIASEESEVSWILNTDLGPLLGHFPHLTHLGIRGGNELELTDLKLPELDTLVIEAGGVSAELVRQVMQAQLPKLRHLELYLGTEEYGATSSAQDFSPILDGKLFPKLKYLGLKNSDYQDEIAQILVSAPVTQQLEVLDLSMGILTDAGGRAILNSENLSHLELLDMEYHWMTDRMVTQLEAWAQQHGIEVDLSDQQEADEEEDEEDIWRYVALGE